jgi:phthalate 4,5-cis-dihydrodiol dehydrogenase
MAASNETIPVLKVGMIGLGRASVSMIPCFVKSPYFQLSAAADVRKEALDQFAKDFNGETYLNAEDLCKSANVDVVYIATPHQYHMAQAVMAAKYGKHIILEKPMALTLEECDMINAAVDRHKVKLVIGHTHSFDRPILKTREIVKSGQLGDLKLIHSFNYTDFLYRPRREEELDTAKGGGIIFNQVPHTVDLIRLIGGGEVRSVRSYTGVWDSQRPTEGSMAAFLDFANGACATMIYSGYDHFDSDEFFGWVSEGGREKKPFTNGNARKELKNNQGVEAKMKVNSGYGGSSQKKMSFDNKHESGYHQHFGVTIVSCEKGDIRPSQSGLIIYGDEGKQEISIPIGAAIPDKEKVLDELYDCVIHDKTPVHNGYWGKATLEVCLAILRSGRQRQEIFLSHQVPVLD